MPSKGWHKRHSGAHLQLLLIVGLATITDDYGPAGAAGGRQPHDLHASAAGRLEQLTDVGRSDPALRGLNDYATTWSGRESV
jgi:hypothetical protein